ncbi:MAG: 1-acyl-sn-glycerol-3-phosphate acyltransferase, partial [Planctomycetes bacterium]|nr:1-acyl-sn-glycerol-3-phosphate acyltransferase [Planctomycetota bacterium]
VGMCINLPLIAICFIFIPEGYKVRPAAIFFRLIVTFFLVRVRVEGLEKLDRSAGYLFMANHASFLDLILLAGYLPGEKRGFEAAHHFSWPLWGFTMRKGGMIPIDRSNPRASLKSIAEAVPYLKREVSVLILPEGTRTTTGRMQEFKKLPFKLAKMGETSIAPVGIIGTFRFKKKTSWLIRPGKVIFRFGEPISKETVQSLDLPALRDLAWKKIAGLCENPGNGKDGAQNAHPTN